MARVIKYRMTAVSFFGHLFSSDTVFGALAWAVRARYGEGRLEELLAEFEERPPFLVSSAMPDGYLPRPLALPRMFKPSGAASREKLVDSISRAKRYGKLRYLPVRLLAKHIGSYDDERVKGEVDLSSALEAEPVEFVHTRTAIDRTRLSALQGALFAESYLHLPEGAALSVYVRLTDASPSDDWFDEIFELMGLSGLGKDRSTGKGVFRVERVALTDDESRVMEHRSEAFMSASLCAGPHLDPVSYATATRYAKIGGEYSQKGIGGRLIINKNPIVFYREGSVFKAGEGRQGSMVRNVHPDPRIVQYGYAFPVGITLKPIGGTQ